MGDKISIREYGRRKGVPESTIRKAIEEGKIKKGYVTHKGKKLIAEIVADEEWFIYHEAKTKGKTREKEKQAREAAIVETLTIEEKEPSTGKRKKSDNINELQYQIEEVKLEKEQILLDKLKGSLVARDEVYAALYAAGQEVRSTFQAIPDRVIDNILAAPTRNDAHQVLTDAINEALKTLAEVESREIIPTA